MKQPFPVAYPHGKSGFRQDHPGGTNARHARKRQSLIHSRQLNWREKPLITAAILTGALVAALTDGPESKIVGKAKLRTYPVQERKGLIWVFIGDHEPPLLEDDVPFEFLDSRLGYGARVRTFRGNWRLAMENALDSSHAFYLHRPAWVMAFTQIQAYKGKYWVEITDDRYVGYKTEEPYHNADYPGLGAWPPRKWWRSRSRHVVKYTGTLPCAAQVKGVLKGKTVYSWFVPVDKDHYRWFQFLGVHGGRLRRSWFQIQYYLVWRWLYQGQFLGQDSWVTDMMHPYYAEQKGWDKERLYRPDVVITAWRKFLGENARGFQSVPSDRADTSSPSSSSPS